MKTRLLVSILIFAGLVFGQAAQVPLCNSFDAATGVPVWTNGTTTTTNCTDYFGNGNFANSPLPAGTITGFTLVAGGSNYTNPVVVIADPTGAGAAGATTLTAGVITAVTVATGGSGYIMPQITIVDVGPGGALGSPACGAPSQPVCGSGAMATAIIGPPFTGGMPKFVPTDLLPSLAQGVPDIATFPGSDFYVIGLQQYTTQMHASLPATTLRGYCQLTAASNYTQCVAGQPSYLGPLIVAQKNRAVRVLFKNMLPAGAGGNLFIPVDTTYMGAGTNMANGMTFGQNRATLHLHGGATPWISDGTPHQWTAPAGDPGQARGPSVSFVPDMWFDANGNLIPSCAGQTACAALGATNDPGPGALTLYWTNQQGGRLMFYHDHSYGITRLNVYAGEAGGYLLYDPTEETALANATAPGSITAGDTAHRIPLVIQDKTFVPGAPQLAMQDPTWAANFGATPLSTTAGNGDLWFPHVYTSNQNPSDPGGANAFGRWDYGPWFYPPQATLTAANPPSAVTSACTSAAFPGATLAPSNSCPTCGCPIIPNASGTPEGFMDTPVVNGKAYPVLHVAPAAYRFQILNAANDRSWNLSWFLADATGKDVAMLPAVPPGAGTPLPLCTAVNPVANPSLVMGNAVGLLDATGNPMNGTGLPAGCWPNYGPQPGIPAPQTMWAADGRSGGAPDPRNAGPAWIQIGTEGGLLAAPVVIPATPVNYEQNTRSITITNVAVHGLWLGPAERADVIVDFSKFAGKTLIAYNDAPTPAPAFDSRVDYFTGDGDQAPIGGAPSTQPGYGPNTRTVMQVVVDATAPNLQTFNFSALKAAFNTTPAGTGVFQATQPTIIVPEAAYSGAYNRPMSNNYASIQALNMTFTPLSPLNVVQPGLSVAACTATAPNQCITLEQKTIQELFTSDYGRMNATLGTELPLTSFLTQTTIPLGYIDPPTEFIQDGETQLWKITHNGVDTHFIHFHLFNVQVVNRMGWDGTIRPPDTNEIGWKETVRMNPLEDIVVALQPVKPTLPWPIPNSIRPLDVTMPIGTSTQFTGINPFTNNPATTANAFNNFGWEYVWHCHILGHEENDMMRPIVFQPSPPAPTSLSATLSASGTSVALSWNDNSADETGFVVQRDVDPAFPNPVVIPVGPSTPTNPNSGQGTSWGGTVVATDSNLPLGSTVFYRVQAVNNAFSGNLEQTWNSTPALLSKWSNTATTTTASPTVTPTALTFLSQLLNTTSPSQTVTISNAAGAGTFVMSGVGFAGANPADFLITANTCTAGLVGGASCTISVAFKAAATGSRSAFLIISNAYNPPIEVSLTGTGMAPIAGVSPTALLFGNNLIGTTSTAQTVTLSNTGTAPLTVNSIAISGSNAGDFLIAGNTCIVAPATTGTLNAPPSSTCAISVTFKPTALGTRSSVLVLTTSDPVNPVLNVSLAGIGQEAIAGISPASLTFPLQLVKTTGTAQTVTLANTGNIAMTISSITLAGANPTDYVLSYTCSVGAATPLAAGGTCTISVQFRPTASGARTASLTIASNALVNPSITVPITGTATSVSLDVTALTFAPQVVGTASAGQSVNLTNIGPTVLLISSVSNVGGNPADFQLTNSCPIGGKGVAAGGTCRITVKFAPTAAGLRSTTLTIASNDPGQPSATVSISGTGLLAGAVVSPISLSFGTVTRGQTSSPQTVTLTNNGNTALTINSISIPGGNGAQFAIQSKTCGTSLAAAASCTISVVFSPRQTGVQTGSLQVNDNAPNSPQTVTLLGTGQ